MNNQYWTIDWESAWATLAFIATIIAAILVIVAITADHRITAYYLTTQQNTVCVSASVNWDADHVVYCSDDPNKTIGVMKAANEGLKTK